MDLINRINENECLAKEIINMSNPSFLNLIHPDWLIHLKNNVLYQKYLNNQVEFLRENSNYKYIKPQRVKYVDDFFKIQVAGSFIYNKANQYSTFTAVNCEPLDELSKVFLDKHSFSNIIINNRAKFFIESCGGIHACASCLELKDKYNLKFDENKEWWCIEKTKIYNGKKIMLSSKYHVENAFGKNPFFAIFQLVVSGRQFFVSDNEPNMKLSGSIKNMILFKETVLELHKPSHLEFVTNSYSSNHSSSSNLTDEHEPRISTKRKISVRNEEDNTQSIMAEHEAANLQFTANFTKAIEMNTFKNEDGVCLPKNEDNKTIKRKRENDDDISEENICVPYNVKYEKNCEQEEGENGEYDVKYVKKPKSD